MRSQLSIRLGALAVALSVTALEAQDPIETGEGWEAFPAVEYQGGHARFPRKMMGTLVLTDSTLEFRTCPSSSCAWVTTGRPTFTDSVIFAVPLRSIRELSASTLTRSPGVGRRIMWGALANDRTNEYFGLAFETESSAEAPTFKVRATQGGALDAKVRFRMRRLGVELPQ